MPCFKLSNYLKMKVLLSMFILVSGLYIFSSFATKVETNGNPELIVAFEKYTPKLAIEFDAAINLLQGIREVGSCEKMNIIYFSYDSSIYKTPEEAFEAIERGMKRFNPLLKIGSNSQEIERACNSL